MIIPLLTLLIAGASARPGRQDIQWGPCKEGEYNSTLPLECGKLQVPLDYTQTNSTKRLELEMVRIPAATQPAQGTIQFNFGGPGEPGREELVMLGPLLQQLSGGAYNLLAFDPRGVNKTLPFVCTTEPYHIGQIADGGRSSKDCDTAARRLWARGEVDNNVCRYTGNGNDTAELVGTAFTARDMISVVDALGEDGMLRYWGFSYGTTLGATLAAMFPERIDKLVIDGVQNPHQYYHEHADFEEWTDTDKAVTYFLSTCVEAGSKKCVLAGRDKTVAELEADLYAFFEKLRKAPIPAGLRVFDVSTLKGFFLGTLKNHNQWPATAQLLDALMYGTEKEQRAAAEAVIGPVPSDEEMSIVPTQGLWAIHCGDTIPRAETFEDIAPTFKKLETISKSAGDTIPIITAHCAQWPWHAKEVYSGDFHVKTKNPILVVGNTIDAHTPLRSAKNVSAGFEGSGLLVVNGTGHASINVPSACTLRQTMAYWLKGTLPEPGNICDAPQAWSGYGWADAIDEVAGNNVTKGSKRHIYNRALL